MDATGDFLSDHHFVALIYPIADAFAAGTNSDVISMQNYRRASIFVVTGAVEDAAVSNIVTVEACDDTTPTNQTAMAFKHRQCVSSTSGDTWTALTAATATGYNFSNQSTMGVANTIWFVEFTSADIESAQAGYEYFRLAVAETVDKTILAGAYAILSDPRYPQAVPVSAIS